MGNKVSSEVVTDDDVEEAEECQQDEEEVWYLTCCDSVPCTPKKVPVTDDKSLDFPWIWDKCTRKYWGYSKVMVIMRGLPGSGKSYLVELLRQIFPKSTVCSADHYFMRDGRYHFNRDELGNAHSSCQRLCKEACAREDSMIIVDNTNVAKWEMKPYVQMAGDYDYVTVLVEPKTDWKLDADVLAERNSHGVDKPIIEKKVRSYKPILPLYYGVFLNDVDSSMLLTVADSWLEACSDLPLFQEWFDEITNSCVLDYFSRVNFIHGTSLIHSTFKYCGKGSVRGSLEYSESEVVQSNLGRSFPLHIVGFVISPRSFGAKIQLGETLLELWGQDDFEVIRNTNVSKREEKTKTRNSESSICMPSLICTRNDRAYERWEVEKGCRAHITLGTSWDQKPVVTGCDVVDVVQAGVEEAPIHEVPLQGALLRHYAREFWVLHLEKEIVVNGIFTGFY